MALIVVATLIVVAGSVAILAGSWKLAGWQIIAAIGIPTAILVAAVATSFAAMRKTQFPTRHHPADRATYLAPCGHFITAGDPFALAANHVSHAQLCPIRQKVH